MGRNEQSPEPSVGVTGNGLLPPLDDNGRAGLLSRSFVALLVTSFTVALNDNMLRWLLVPIGKSLMNDNLARAVGLAAFTAPFLLLAAVAGYTADRFSKRTVMIWCKAAEVLIVLTALGAILAGNVWAMFLLLLMMGSQSAFFVPAKFGSIPEIVRGRLIAPANGLIGMVSMLAIIAGTWAGNVLYDLTTIPGQGLPGTHRWWISAVALLSMAAGGLAASLLIGQLPAANPQRRLSPEVAGETLRALRMLFSHRNLFLVALASAFFWGLGAMSQLMIDKFAQFELYVSQAHTGPLLGILVFGIALGNGLAGIISRGTIELGLVPVGAAGIAINAVLLCTVPESSPDAPTAAAYWWTMFWLWMLGLSAGLFDVPLQAYLQKHSPPQSRGTILAAYNFMAFAAILLASPISWILCEPLGLSARQVFVVSGIGTLAVLIVIVSKIPRQTLRLILEALIRLGYRVRIEGLEHFPQHGPVMLVANHLSYLDGFLLGVLLPRRVRFIVYADYFTGWWVRWFAWLAEVIPIYPGKRSVVVSLRNAQEALLAGRVVGVFPEGTLSPDGQIHEFQPGFLRVIRGTEAPVIPVYLDGLWGSVFSRSGGRILWKVLRRVMSLRRRRVLIRIGPAIRDPLDAEQVRQAIIRLGQGQYQQQAQAHWEVATP